MDAQEILVYVLKKLKYSIHYFFIRQIATDALFEVSF